MPKNVSALELTLEDRAAGQPLTRWLYQGFCRAILDGRLRSGTRLPATRDFARHYGVSRGTVVNVFEQLQADGYIRCRVGAGTWVNDQLPQTSPRRDRPLQAPAKVLPEPLSGLNFSGPSRPFRMSDPALDHFPAKVWARIASRRLRRFSTWAEAKDNGRGFRPLCEAVADYLGSSRGVKCSPDQVVIVSGVQQALDLLARLLLRPGEAVWMEDPGYFGANIAFRNAGAKMIAIPVDSQGISVAEGRRIASDARGAYVTPGHQFPLGVTLSLERRLALLAWAKETGAFVIEDDYDSEFRFGGRPVPALASLDSGAHVILLGTFNKVLFPSLRLGYAVLPPVLIEPFLALRYGADLRSTNLEQAVLHEFIAEGHLGRHLRRMRELYAARLGALLDAGRAYLAGLLDISGIRAGLYTPGFLRNGMTSRQAEAAAWAGGVDSMGLDRFTLARPDPRGLLLGFAAFGEREIRRGGALLAAALERGAAAADGRRAVNG